MMECLLQRPTATAVNVYDRVIYVNVIYKTLARVNDCQHVLLDFVPGELHSSFLFFGCESGSEIRSSLRYQFRTHFPHILKGIGRTCCGQNTVYRFFGNVDCATSWRFAPLFHIWSQPFGNL